MEDQVVQLRIAFVFGVGVCGVFDGRAVQELAKHCLDKFKVELRYPIENDCVGGYVGMDGVD